MLKTLACALLVTTACGRGDGGRRAPQAAVAPTDACASAMKHLDDVLRDPSVSDPDGARAALTSGFAEACRRDQWSRAAIECFVAVARPLDVDACTDTLTEAQLRAMDAVYEEVARTKRRPTKLRPPVEVAKSMVAKYAFEGYPMWAMAHPDKACPELLDEVAAVLDASALVDPWGRPYVMMCGDTVPSGSRVRGLGVMSLGPDGQRDTADDITSWDQDGG